MTIQLEIRGHIIVGTNTFGYFDKKSIIVIFYDAVNMVIYAGVITAFHKNMGTFIGFPSRTIDEFI